jgi:hypothetical protein
MNSYKLSLFNLACVLSKILGVVSNAFAAFFCCSLRFLLTRNNDNVVTTNQVEDFI